MPSDLYQLIAIVPAENLEAANLLADSDDFGNLGPVFSVGLSATGQDPATHYGCHNTMTPAAFVQNCEGAWADTLASLGIQIFTIPYTGELNEAFWPETLASLGLQRIEMPL